MAMPSPQPHASTDEHRERRTSERRIEARVVGDVVLVEQVLDSYERFQRFAERIASGEIDDVLCIDRQCVIVVRERGLHPAKLRRDTPALRTLVAQRNTGAVARDTPDLKAYARRIETVFGDLRVREGVGELRAQGWRQLPCR